MKTVRRIYVEKREGYDVCSGRLLADFRDNLGISGLTGVRTINRYDVQGLPDEHYQAVRNTVFADPSADHIYDEEIPLDSGGRAFAVELVPGQYNQRADSVAQAIQLLAGGERPTVETARIIALTGNISDGDFEKIKAYYINPVESRETSFDKLATLNVHFDQPADVLILTGFTGLDRAGINGFADELGLAMKTEDLLHCQQYFRDAEKRDPTITEIRMLDTYWSDHCRHTTFLTNIKNVEIENTALNTPVKTAFETYRQARDYVYGDNVNNKNISLMDIAQMGMKELRKKGMLDDLDVSDEINACSIVVPVVIDGKNEEWLIMFKNETHNHPTEIEPFGGAATCLGGGIRDPLSGRSYVYQAMRVTGAGDPRTPVSETLPGKLPQRKITTTAAQGYSAYGNQIGVAAGIVSEIYHEGYVAKRMEVGALVAAVPKSNVVRHEPKPGDIVVLLGGKTGRDGCGGATGSSKEHTEESASVCSAEVQKGNPSVEHYIQRLFRDPGVSRMIRRCNDFGAGGVSVAIGELAAGLDIDLDAVPVKYDGLDGTEIAISESQERMAVVIDPADLKKFEERAAAENLETAVVAKVTDSRRLKMVWRGKTIVDLSRDFIDTNGIIQETEVFVKSPPVNDGGHDSPPPIDSLAVSDKWRKGDSAGAFFETMSDLNVCGQRGMVEMFDGTVGASTVLMPFGGKYQGTPIEAMVAKLPLVNGETVAGTAMAYGYDPYLSSWSPFHGAVYAVIHSAAKIVAVGGDYRRIRLSFQEYFERLGDDKTRWGKPFAALLGAYFAQSKLGIAAIGGKDSMSGTFKDINVPPTLISFAVAPVDVSKVISPEFKQAGNTVVFISIRRDEFEMPSFDVIDKCYGAVHDGINKGQILSVHTVGRGGVAEAVSKMCFGNRVGFKFDDGVNLENLFMPNYGGLVVELDGQNRAGAKILELDENCKTLGLTIEEKKIAYNNMDIDLEKLYHEWEQPLSNVFPVDARIDVKADTNIGTAGDTQRLTSPKSAKTKIAKPRVLIPILPGTNCGYDMERRFTKAGAACDQFVVKNLTHLNIDESIKAMAKKIADAQIMIVPGGFGAGDGQDGSGNFAAAFFRNPRIKDAVTKFINNGDGLILGTGSGFQALIKLGLLPYGEIRDIGDGEKHPALTFNTVGRHISRMAYAKIRSVNSPWLTNVNFGEVYATPISHGEARFAVSSEQLHALLLSGQIATQYVNSSGQFEEGINGNCTYSVYAVEGLLSPDGRIFGKTGHCERIGEEWVAKNIVGNKDMKIFEAGVSFFG
ncbi:MAG: phosphoribosylformylglycinamidine synthase [Chitinispirillales bacterium]|jgi:phosphoribosylformylglycinamidine synthase|nr:phosphoribosylformylglycinamidine synthase [Chitinispirillales bacterium]